MIAGVQALAVVAVLASGPGSSVGAGIQPGPVCAATTVQPGGSYTLPPIGVNGGDAGTEHVALYVTRQTPRTRGILPGRVIPASWVQFSYGRGWWGLARQLSVKVTPGTQKLVPAQLTLPSTAPLGSYAAWIIAAPPGSTAAQLNNSASAIADFEFTVVRPGSPPSRGPCITPGLHAKPAKPASHPKPRPVHTPAAAESSSRGVAPAAPSRLDHSPKTYAIIAGLTLGGLALIVPRRRRRR